MNVVNMIRGDFPLFTPAVITTIVFLFAWLPSSIAKHGQLGVKYLVGNRSGSSELSGWGGRVERAYENWKSYFPGFIMAISLLSIKGKVEPSHVNACWLYLAARVSHMTFYGMGIPKLRFISFMISFSSVIYLLLQVLK